MEASSGGLPAGEVGRWLKANREPHCPHQPPVHGGGVTAQGPQTAASEADLGIHPPGRKSLNKSSTEDDSHAPGEDGMGSWGGGGALGVQQHQGRRNLGAGGVGSWLHSDSS